MTSPRLPADPGGVCGLLPVRCRDVCKEAGMETEACYVEGMRSRLKRMVERGLLAETEPGLFTLTDGGGV